MKCYYHPEVDAVATCTSCGKAICQSCAVDVAGRLYCQQCLASGITAKSRLVETTPTNSLAIVSLALGILGLLGCACGGSIGGILFGAPASITGWIARKQLLQAQQEQQGMQLATIGLVLGIAEVIMSVVLLILFGAAIGWDVIRTLLRQSSY